MLVAKLDRLSIKMEVVAFIACSNSHAQRNIGICNWTTVRVSVSTHYISSNYHIIIQYQPITSLFVNHTIPNIPFPGYQCKDRVSVKVRGRLLFVPSLFYVRGKWRGAPDLYRNL